MTTAVETTPESVSEMLEGLSGLSVSGSEFSTNLDPKTKTNICAIYSDNEGQVHAALLCDIALANNLGASLTRVPPGVATENAKDGIIPESLYDNFKEVMNICVSLFKGFQSRRLTLSSVHGADEDTPENVLEFLSSDVNWQTFKIEIGNYSIGTLSLVVR